MARNDLQVRIIINSQENTGGFGKTKQGLASIDEQLASIKNRVTGFLGLSLGAVVFGKVGDIIKTADAYKGMEARLKLVVGEWKNLIKVQNELFAISQRSRNGLEETVTLYTKMASATKTLGASQEQILKVTETVNQAIALSGTGAQQASAALLQFGQALSSSRGLAGDEYKSLSENAPEVLRAIAEGIGVTIGQLREMSIAGELAPERILKALEKAAPEIERKFKQLPLSVGQSFTQLENAFTRFIGEADKSGGATTVLAHTISVAAENFKALANTSIIVADIYAVKLVQSLVLSTKAWFANRDATKAKAAADIEAEAIARRLAQANAAALRTKITELEVNQKALVEQRAVHQQTLLDIDSKSASAVATLRSASANRFTVITLLDYTLAMKELEKAEIDRAAVQELLMRNAQEQSAINKKLALETENLSLISKEGTAAEVQDRILKIKFLQLELTKNKELKLAKLEELNATILAARETIAEAEVKGLSAKTSKEAADATALLTKTELQRANLLGKIHALDLESITLSQQLSNETRILADSKIADLKAMQATIVAAEKLNNTEIAALDITIANTRATIASLEAEGLSRSNIEAHARAVQKLSEVEAQRAVLQQKQIILTEEQTVITRQLTAETARLSIAQKIAAVATTVLAGAVKLLSGAFSLLNWAFLAYIAFDIAGSFYDLSAAVDIAKGAFINLKEVLTILGAAFNLTDTLITGVQEKFKTINDYFNKERAKLTNDVVTEQQEREEQAVEQATEAIKQSLADRKKDYEGFFTSLEYQYQLEQQAIDKREQEQKANIEKSVLDETQRNQQITDVILAANEQRISEAKKYVDEKIRITDNLYAAELNKATVTEEQRKQLNKQRFTDEIDSLKTAADATKKGVDAMIAEEHRHNEAARSLAEQRKNLVVDAEQAIFNFMRESMDNQQKLGSFAEEEDKLKHDLKIARANENFKEQERIAERLKELALEQGRVDRQIAEENGDSAVIASGRAVEGYKQAVKYQQEALRGMQETEETAASKAKDRAADAGKTLDDLQKRISDMQIELSTATESHHKIIDNFDEIMGRVKSLEGIVTRSKHIIEQESVQKRRHGGFIFKFNAGGKLPGFGGGDKVPALLEAGEFVIRKEAVAKYGAGLFSQLNDMNINLGDVIKRRLGGIIPQFSGGGSVDFSFFNSAVANSFLHNSTKEIPWMSGKSVTVEFKGQGGQSVSAQFAHQNDVNSFLNIIKDSGGVTA